MNEGISSFLTYYISLDDPQYAIMLNGKWGCGKTYYIKHWIDVYKEENKGNEEAMTPIYVSLFGLNEISQITDAIDREIHPFLHSKFMGVAKGLAKFASKAVLRTDIDFNGDDKKDATIDWQIDTLSIFNSDDKELRPLHLLIFDDMERCDIEMRQLLGYFNFFVEQCHCKVIIIGDESKIGQENEIAKKIFEDFKEKTIGRSFTINNDISSAIEVFVSESPGNYLMRTSNWKDAIYKAFKTTGFNNLRVLRQALTDFKINLNNIDKQLVEKDSDFFKILMVQFIIVYAEFKCGDHNTLEQWNSQSTQILLNFSGDNLNNSEKGKKVAALKDKYQALSNEFNENLLHPTFVSLIIDSLKTGSDIALKIRSIVESRLNIPLTQRLDNWLDMSNNELEEVYEEVENLIRNKKKIHFTYYIFFGIWMMIIEEYIGKKMSDESLSLIKNNISDYLYENKDINQLYLILREAKQSFTQYRYNTEKIKEFSSWFFGLWDSIAQLSKDPYETLLENLTDENVSKLIEMERVSTPDHCQSYDMVSIFKKVDIDKHVKAVLSLSNKGKNIYGSFLASRYHLGYRLDYLDKCFAEDIEPFERAKILFTNSLKTLKGIDALNVKRIIGDIDKIIELGHKINWDNVN